MEPAGGVSGHKRRRDEPSRDDGVETKEADSALAEEEDGGDYKEYVPLKVRRAQEEARRRAKRGLPAEEEGGGADGAPATGGAGVNAEAADYLGNTFTSGESLFDAAQKAAASGVGPASNEEKRRRIEEELLAQVTQVQRPSLVSAKEYAEGIKYTEPFQSDWRPPAAIRALSEEDKTALRKKYHILVEGEGVPAPIKSFKDMRLPQPIIDALAAKGIKNPTPIQVQGLPVAFAGRDMIGVAFTGSGKTLVFTLPLVMFALQEELRMPLTRGEGPVGIIMAPSRELARQTYDGVQHFCKFLTAAGFPELRCMLAIGGEDMRSQLEPVQKGCHMVIATPGRLNDHLNKKRINLDICRLLVLDEGDRMLDMGFDEEIKNVFSFFPPKAPGDTSPYATRQVVIFSATMPKKIKDFAQEALVKPIVVNVGRAGAANLDVIQQVEYVKQEAKIVYLLQCLQTTAPPVVIFAENKRDVDEIHEYLLLKGVGAVSIHGGKSQEERNDAIAQFKAGEKDVLVATDIAAKGLDFPDIQHVINFDMPREVENYVHRIGRTGRCGKTGVATTFINKSVDESILLDLKHLLMEAKQRVPPVLLALDDPADLAMDEDLGKGCSYCNGLGHRITECPKLEQQRKQMSGPRKDYLRGGES